MHNQIEIPIKLPQDKRKRIMAHAEYIANTIRTDIQQFRTQSFDNFGVQVRIHPVPTAFEVHDIRGTWLGFNKYVFEAHGSEPKAMEVTVDHEWNVKVYYLGAWRRLSAYLKNVKPCTPWDQSASKIDIMHLRWRQQADWWNENGKIFTLMRLPPEIREMIYEHIWSPIIEPFPTSSARKLTMLGKLSRKLRMPNSNLLLTCRQVSAEASNILFLRTPFFIQHYGVLKALTSKMELRGLVRHLSLAFSHDEFMHLFSTDHVRRDRKTSTEVVGLGYPALALRSMKLSSLCLTIAPPSLTTKSGAFDGACQRVAFELIMAAAWPVIRGHPLELGGYVKHIQKQIYQARDVLERKRVQAWQKRRAAWGLPEGSLAEYDLEMDEEVGGISLSGSKPEAAPEQTPAPEYNLKCSCDPPCTEETWVW